MISSPVLKLSKSFDRGLYICGAVVRQRHVNNVCFQLPRQRHSTSCAGQDRVRLLEATV